MQTRECMPSSAMGLLRTKRVSALSATRDTQVQTPSHKHMCQLHPRDALHPVGQAAVKTPTSGEEAESTDHGHGMQGVHELVAEGALHLDVVQPHRPPHRARLLPRHPGDGPRAVLAHGGVVVANDALEQGAQAEGKVLAGRGGQHQDSAGAARVR